jgi:biopolymer transport protein ExbB/TolQ
VPETASVLRALAAALELPTHALLLGGAALALFDLGLSIGERAGGLARLARSGNVARFEALARRRLDRAELYARIGPMAGLMGTLIPLGPGLAALGRGEVQALARAVTVAFDTTVLGLAIGALGFCLHRLRRRWYESWLERLESREAGA